MNVNNFRHISGAWRLMAVGGQLILRFRNAKVRGSIPLGSTSRLAHNFLSMHQFRSGALARVSYKVPNRFQRGEDSGSSDKRSTRAGRRDFRRY
jgi:hypothetical protein